MTRRKMTPQETREFVKRTFREAREALAKSREEEARAMADKCDGCGAVLPDLYCEACWARRREDKRCTMNGDGIHAWKHCGKTRTCDLCGRVQRRNRFRWWKWEDLNRDD